MNKLILFSLFAAFTITGCSKKNDSTSPSNKTNSSIVGKWNYDSDTIKMYDNGVEYQEYTDDLDESDFDQFNKDGTGIQAFADTGAFTYTFVGKNLTFNFPAYKNKVGYVLPAHSNLATVPLLTDKDLTIFFDDIENDPDGHVYRTTEVDHLIKSN